MPSQLEPYKYYEEPHTKYTRYTKCLYDPDNYYIKMKVSVANPGSPWAGIGWSEQAAGRDYPHLLLTSNFYSVINEHQLETSSSGTLLTAGQLSAGVAMWIEVEYENGDIILTFQGYADEASPGGQMMLKPEYGAILSSEWAIETSNQAIFDWYPTYLSSWKTEVMFTAYAKFGDCEMAWDGSSTLIIKLVETATANSSPLFMMDPRHDDGRALQVGWAGAQPIFTDPGFSGAVDQLPNVISPNTPVSVSVIDPSYRQLGLFSSVSSLHSTSMIEFKPTDPTGWMEIIA
jgi:hypothetical protein